MHEGFHFVANLKPYTVRRGAGNRRFGAYLLSVDYRKDFRDLAREVVDDGVALCADNGNFDLIRKFVADHAATAKGLEGERRRLRVGTIPTALRDRYRALAANIRVASDAATNASRIASTVSAQLEMEPTYLVAMEDFTVATMTGLGIDAEHFQLGSAFYRATAKRAVDFAVETAGGRYGRCRATAFAGLHSADYDSARIAGRVAGEAGVAGIATGLGFALQDSGYTDHLIENGKRISLTARVPRPYVRVAEIVAGLHEGYVAASRQRPCFHALGVGTPILLPLLAALGDGRTYTGTDSTAPIADGWSAPTISLYVDEPAPLKLKGYRIVEEWLSNGREWSCRCPYCNSFERTYPHRVDEAARWWKAQGKPRLANKSMSSSSPLTRWLPLFGNAADAGLRFAAAMARVGHNHWVLQRIEASVRNHSGSHDKLMAWVDGIVEAYRASAAADPRWKSAVEVAWRIIRRAAESTHGATPTSLPSR
jgi:hypothetical protein